MYTPHTWRELIDQLLIRRTPFFVIFFVVTFLTYAFLYALDFYPEPISTTDSTTAETAVTGETDEIEADTIDSSTPPSFQVTIPEIFSVEESAPETPVEAEAATEPQVTAGAAFSGPAVPAVLPTSMYIERLDRTVPVLNPTSRAIADLDQALLGGTVRHPDSADLANTGNVFILGHSSYLPNVFNKNFQAFNGIQELEWGDRIVLTSDGEQYVYRVDRVYEARAADVIVPHTPGEARLTLATCDSFGSKDDRFIVEARLVGSAS